MAHAAPSRAALTFGVNGTWDTQARRDAAAAAMQAVVDRYNAYGDFTRNNDGNIEVTYNAGVATADANYNAGIRFGGTYPAERVAQHESNHWLGSGTTSQWTNRFDANGNWTGPKMNQLAAQFDGDGVVTKQSGVHFYGYGLNFDSEVVNGAVLQRNIALAYAQRQDDGLGTQADPWTATSVVLTKSDAIGTSSFNWSTGWNDGYFAHASAAYSTGNFTIRTPLDTYNPSNATPSFTFAGKSLTVNNSNGINGGLLFKSVGTTGVTTFANLILDGGVVRHASGVGDLFQLAGKVTVNGSSTIVASQGNINVLAAVAGTGTISVLATDAPTEDNRYVRLLSNANAFAGNVDVSGGRFQLGDGANQRFVVGASGINNAIAGVAARRVLLDGVFQFDLTSAGKSPGSIWRLVSAANVTYGSTFRVEGFAEATPGLWTNAAGYAFNEATGTLVVVPEPATFATLTTLAGAIGARRKRA